MKRTKSHQKVKNTVKVFTTGRNSSSAQTQLATGNDIYGAIQRTLGKPIFSHLYVALPSLKLFERLIYSAAFVLTCAFSLCWETTLVCTLLSISVGNQTTIYSTSLNVVTTMCGACWMRWEKSTYDVLKSYEMWQEMEGMRDFPGFCVNMSYGWFKDVFWKIYQFSDNTSYLENFQTFSSLTKPNVVKNDWYY